MNPYKAAARAKKIASLLRTLDQRKNRAGLDDEGLLNLVASWTKKDWNRLALEAQVNQPSETTISEVYTALKERITGEGS